ncbi:MAG TPA: hypothetical protein VGL09_19405 [Methylomirabilota bacterium]
MAELFIAATLIGGLVVAPLLVAEWRERRADQALALRAVIDAVVRRDLGGDSFLSVTVVPKAPWRPGRVVLSTPSGYDWLVTREWPLVLREMPADYELIVRPAGERVVRPAAVPTLRHA